MAHDIVETLLALAEHCSYLEEWQENERQVGVICQMAADEIIQLREDLRMLTQQRMFQEAA